MSAKFDTACLVAAAAARELDESTRWQYYDPARFARARARATVAFDLLVAAFRQEVGANDPEVAQ